MSTIHQASENVTLGAAFNQVRDGVSDAMPDQPIRGDQSLIGGIRWQNASTYTAATFTDFENHEKDDEGNFFGGYGFEIYVDHLFTKRFGIGGTYNYQKSTTEPGSQFKIDFVSFGGSYFIGDSWRFYLIYKYDQSLLVDGSPAGQNTLGAAVFYNFSWGFAPF